MDLYLVLEEGWDDQNIMGVYTTEDAARQRASALADQSRENARRLSRSPYAGRDMTEERAVREFALEYIVVVIRADMPSNPIENENHHLLTRYPEGDE